MNRLIEIIRKIAVICSYLVIGGFGFGSIIYGATYNEPLAIGLGLALVISSWLIHKVLNWIFQ